MKSKTLKTVNEAVAKATPETFGAAISSAKVSVHKYKEHTNYSSAFAIGEHAELRLDFFDKQPPFGRIEGIEFSTEGITCNVAIAISQRDESIELREFHSHSPIRCIDSRLLKHFDAGNSENPLNNPLKNKYPLLPNSQFQIGDVVQFDIKEIKDCNLFAIPVLIWGVNYTEGKIKYNISLDCDQYRGTRAFDDIYDRYLKHSMDNVDGAFIQPVGGWETIEVDAPVLNKLESK